MAEGGAVQVEGLREAIQSMNARADRLMNLGTALKVVAAEIDKRSSDAFVNQRSPAGEPWPRLANSTLIARSRQSKASKRRSKRTGKLTKTAAWNRIANIVTAKPLQNTGRLKNSAHTRVIGETIEWSEVGYGAPHITGGVRGNHAGRPPKRNMSVFERGPGGVMMLIPRVQFVLLSEVARYISGSGV